MRPPVAHFKTDLYGSQMKDRLSRDDWVSAGLKALTGEGEKALRADRLARSIGVSRGSFYWHFKDLADFHDAVLSAWRERTTEAVIDALSSSDASREARLARLVRDAFAFEAPLERAIRSWATSEPRARDAVEAVDARRTGYLRELMAGREMADAKAKLIYLAFVGYVMRPNPEETLSETDAAALLQAALAE